MTKFVKLVGLSVAVLSGAGMLRLAIRSAEDSVASVATAFVVAASATVVLFMRRGR